MMPESDFGRRVGRIISSAAKLRPDVDCYQLCKEDYIACGWHRNGPYTYLAIIPELGALSFEDPAIDAPSIRKVEVIAVDNLFDGQRGFAVGMTTGRSGAKGADLIHLFRPDRWWGAE